MEPVLKLVTDAAEIDALLPRLEILAAELMSEFRDEPLPAGAVGRLLQRSGQEPQTILLRADAAPGDPAADPLGLLLTAPFEDPLTGERVPLVVLLHVRPDVRHRGIARRLVEQALQTLAERGLDRLAARAGHNDDALISMGERWGFVRSWELMLRE